MRAACIFKVLLLLIGSNDGNLENKNLGQVYFINSTGMREIFDCIKQAQFRVGRRK